MSSIEKESHIRKQGRIHGKTVSDGLAREVKQKSLAIQKCYGWNDGQTDGWMERRTDGWTDGRTNKRTDPRMDRLTWQGVVESHVRD